MDILFLNGASSAGKTSIVKALQNILPEPYLHIGIDKFLGMMPEHCNDWTGETVQDGFYWQDVRLDDGSNAYRITAGGYGVKINRAYRSTCANLANDGLKLIIDDVTNGIEEFLIWKQLLKPYKTLYIGVLCDIETLKIREKQRGNRKIGTAIEQFFRVHSGIEYDLTVNTTNRCAKNCAKLIMDRMA